MEQGARALFNYLTQRRNKDRETQVTSVTIYSNIGVPKVYLNGKELQGIRKGYTDVHFVIDQVVLSKGKNVVVAVAVDDLGNEYRDEIIWYYDGEKHREVDNVENNDEHAGF